MNRDSTQNNETPAPWHSLPVAEVLRALDSDGHQGLSREEAARRLERVGPNVLVATGVAKWPAVLGRQFVDVRVLDHVIVSGSTSVSFAERGLL